MWATALRWICKCSERSSQEEAEEDRMMWIKEEKFPLRGAASVHRGQWETHTLGDGYSKAVINPMMGKNSTPDGWSQSNVFFPFYNCMMLTET